MSPHSDLETHSRKRLRSASIISTISDRTKRRCGENNDGEHDPRNTSNSINTVNGCGNARTQVGDRFADYKPTNNYYGQQPAPAEPSSTIEGRRQILLKSLRFKQDDARRDTVELECSGTCEWLLDEMAYRDWLDPTKLAEHHGFLWIKGKPGAGKSTLMKFAVSEARKRQKDSNIINFFFNARGNDLEKSTIGMYRWLLWELLTTIPALQTVFDSSKRLSWNIREDYQWSLQPLKELFMDSILSLGSMPVLCFIDALDECDDTEIDDMLSFFEDVCDKAIEEGRQFRVYFSSRHYPTLSIKPHIPLTLEDQEGHMNDITLYIQKKLNIGKSTTAEKIKEALQEKASGVFLWVFLVVGILNKEFKKGKIKALEQRLKEIPADLHELFRTILLRDNEDRSDLILCIQWMLFARQPLTPEQLYFAMQSGLEPDKLSSWDPNEITIEDIKRFLLNSSKGLAEITRSRAPTVQFIHESVRDYLLKENGLREIWPDLNDGFRALSHDILKYCCVTYMKVGISDVVHLRKPPPQAPTTDFADLRKIVDEKYPLMEYAVSNILYHAEEAESRTMTQVAFVSNFPLTDWIYFNNLFERYEKRRYTSRTSLLYILAAHNLPRLIAIDRSVLSYLRAGAECYGPPLFAALATGSDLAVRAFLEAEMNQQYNSEKFKHFCELFLQNERRQLPWRRDFHFSKRRGVSGHLAEKSIELLCALSCIGKADINVRDEGGKTPLTRAAEQGHGAVVEMLLDTGMADANAMDKEKQSPLHRAAANDHIYVVELLIHKGADKEASLLVAARAGYLKVAKLLLENGTDKEAKDVTGRTPLHIAANNGHSDVVDLLVAAHAEKNARDEQGRTPLYWAASSGRHDVVKRLIIRGADKEASGYKGWTPLHMAVRADHFDVAKELVDKLANKQATDKKGRTPLDLAISNDEHSAFVRLLK